MSDISATAAIRASRALEADAMRMLAEIDDPKLSRAERHRLDAAAGRLYRRMARLDQMIVHTSGTLADGIAKVCMALELAEPDHRDEPLWLSLLRSGVADLTAAPGARQPKRQRRRSPSTAPL